MATIDEIKQQAAAVKNATQVGENTAERVGGALAGLADFIKELVISGKVFAGIARKDTIPSANDNVFYIVTETGDYDNFNLKDISTPGVIYKKNGYWFAEDIIGNSLFPTVDLSKKGSIEFETVQDAINAVNCLYKRPGQTIAFKLKGDGEYKIYKSVGAFTGDPCGWIFKEECLNGIFKKQTSLVYNKIISLEKDETYTESNVDFLLPNAIYYCELIASEDTEINMTIGNSVSVFGMYNYGYALPISKNTRYVASVFAENIKNLILWSKYSCKIQIKLYRYCTTRAENERSNKALYMISSITNLLHDEAKVEEILIDGTTKENAINIETQIFCVPYHFLKGVKYKIKAIGEGVFSAFGASTAKRIDAAGADNNAIVDRNILDFHDMDMSEEKSNEFVSSNDAFYLYFYCPSDKMDSNLKITIKVLDENNTHSDLSKFDIEDRYCKNIFLKSLQDKLFPKVINPIIYCDTSDPTIWDGEDGYYYLYTSSWTGNQMTLSDVRIKRSSNMINWEDCSIPFDDTTLALLKSTSNYGWAPVVTKIGDKWNMYFSLEKSGNVVALTSDTPFGYFRFKNDIKSFILTSTITGIVNIDADVVKDRYGRVWMFWGSDNGIYRTRLSDDGLSLYNQGEFEKVHVAGLNASSSGFGSDVYEGASLYFRDGYWYLFASGGQTFYGGQFPYHLVVGRSKTIDGEYVDDNGNKMTEGHSFTILSEDTNFKCPGHCSRVFTDKKGKTYIFFHVVMQTGYRYTSIAELKWRKDGFPYIEGNAVPLILDKPSF